MDKKDNLPAITAPAGKPGQARRRQALDEMQVHRTRLEKQNQELRAAQAELNAERARFFDLYDLAPVGYFTVSEKGLILEANLAAAGLLGLSREELVKQPLCRFIHKEHQDLYNLHRKKLFETGLLQTCELRIKKKDETAFWASLTASAEKDAGGATVCRIVMSDIADRKLGEEYRETGRVVLQILNNPGPMQALIRRVLAELKARTGFDAVGIRLQYGDDFPYFVQEGFPNDFLLTENTLIERNADGEVCRDKDGNVRLECTCGMVISNRAKPDNPFFTPGGSCWTNDSFPLLDIPVGEDFRRNPRNQCMHHGYASLALVPIRNMGRIVGLIQLNDRRKDRFTLETVELLETIASHIGEALMRKRTEDALRETQAILKAAMDNCLVGIAIADAPDGALWYVNDAGHFILGGDRKSDGNGVGIDQYVASWRLMNIDGCPLKSDEVPLARAIMFGETSSRELVIRRAIDDNRVVLANAAPIMDDNGNVVAGIMAFIDITGRKNMEQALKKSHEILEKKVAERTAELVVAMKAAEKEKEKAQTALSEIKKLKEQLEAERAYLQDEIKLENNHEEIIGQSKVLKYVLYKIGQIAASDTTVLVLGETGTGKELVARAIHDLSLRKKRALVKVNCATLPPNLIESELFGHEKGAFTGSHVRHLGRFEVASGATLFLDEIGELPMELQPKLLRVLQDGEFERLGSSRTIKVDARIIATTNRNLEEEVRKGRFREDLWYRLNVFPITLPPLRDRMEDIPLLVNYYVKKISKRIGRIIEIIPASVMNALQHYHWPGNIRELENVLARAVINSPGPKLRLIDELKKPLKDKRASQKTLEAVERSHILQTLELTNWKVGGKEGAAEILGLDRSTLRARMRKLDIQKPYGIVK